MYATRPLRRLLAALACTSVLIVPQAATSAAPARQRLLEGDLGSGPSLPPAPGPRPTNGIRWSDVPKKHWARTAIDYVGATYDWMRDFRLGADGTYEFRPDALESRALFARAAVAAFAPEEPVDASIHFADLPDDDRFYPSANVSVKLGWLRTDADGNFAPDDAMTTSSLHRALVFALGFGDVAKGAQDLHMHNGKTFDTPADFGWLLLGMRLGLRYNHEDETLDVGPDTPLPRSEVAWSLYRAATEPSWTAETLAPYATIELPNLSAAMHRVVNFGIRYVGYPYVWSGEWFETTPAGYCCGYQPIGGFDCSGFTWWLMRAASSDWNPMPPRDYRGWALPQRSSAEMASSGHKVRFKALEPGDLVFYDGDGNGQVDHVDVYLGNGWAMDSGSSVGGVSIVKVDEGWYRDHFVHGRRVTQQSAN